MTDIGRVKTIAFIMNLLDVFGVAIILIAAFVFQFVLYELPCPLCLLQRLGLLGIALGISMNLSFGLRASHYAISCLSAIYLAAVAMRQILLHINPGSPGYGSPILGLHMYTWSFIIAVAFIIFILLGFFLDQQFSTRQFKQPVALRRVAYVLLVLLVLLSLVNTIAVFVECGFSQCPDNPTRYLYGLVKSYIQTHFFLYHSH